MPDANIIDILLFRFVAQLVFNTNSELFSVCARVCMQVCVCVCVCGGGGGGGVLRAFVLC